MKGDIAFAGFLLTAEEWQALDADSRAQLIAVATRRMDRLPDPPRRFPDGTGKHDIVPIELDSADLIELEDDHEPDSNLEPPSTGEPSSDGGWEDFADLNEG